MIKDLKKAANNPAFNIPRTITFNGTVKLHGTNGGVSYSNGTGLYAIGRNTLLDLTYDNQGFAFFVKQNEALFVEKMKYLADKYSVNLDVKTITLYGEWAGERIQKGVAICKLPKFFAIFDGKISESTKSVENDGKDRDGIWFDVSMKNDVGKCILARPEARIYNVYDFKTFNVTVNLDDLESAQELLEKYTKEVENECPFASEFGIHGTGEGIVWHHQFAPTKRWTFKTKGEEHKVYKESTVVTINQDIVKNVADFVDRVVTPARFEQAINMTYIEDPASSLYMKEKSIKDVPKIIKWISQDIIKEEIDVMCENNFDMKMIMPELSKKVVLMFKQLLDSSLNESVDKSVDK